jgi:hypothetical protein
MSILSTRLFCCDVLVVLSLELLEDFYPKILMFTQLSDSVIEFNKHASKLLSRRIFEWKLNHNSTAFCSTVSVTILVRSFPLRRVRNRSNHTVDFLV